MIVIKNQTIYKCSYCGKRMLTKKGCAIHEMSYCRDDNSPRVKNCKHEKVETVYPPIVGEPFRDEPDYDYCTECGKQF